MGEITLQPPTAGKKLRFALTRDPLSARKMCQTVRIPAAVAERDRTLDRTQFTPTSYANHLAVKHGGDHTAAFHSRKKLRFALTRDPLSARKMCQTVRIPAAVAG